MARPCSVCAHPDRAAIDQAILNGKAASAVARDFGFTYHSRKDGRDHPDHKIITRHRDTCMPDAYQAAMAEAKVQNGVALAARLKYLDECVDQVIQRAKAGTPIVTRDADGTETPMLNPDGSPVLRYEDRLLLAAIREGRANVEILAKLAGHDAGADEGDVEALRQAMDNPKVRALLAEIDALTAPGENGSGD